MIESALILAKNDKILQPIHFPSLVEDKKRRVSSGSESAAQIYKSLPDNPMTLPKLAQKYGEPKAIEVGSLYLMEKKKWPTEEDAHKLFNSKPGAVRIWLTMREVTLEKLM